MPQSTLHLNGLMGLTSWPAAPHRAANVLAPCCTSSGPHGSVDILTLHASWDCHRHCCLPHISGIWCYQHPRPPRLVGLWPQHGLNWSSEYLFLWDVALRVVGASSENLTRVIMVTFRYDKAKLCTQCALVLNPMFMKARYRCGLVRKGNLEFSRGAIGKSLPCFTP